jgi:hypothetical protein
VKTNSELDVLKESLSNISDAEELLEVNHKKSVLSKELAGIDSQSKIEYFIKTSDILFEYYETGSNTSKNTVTNIMSLFNNQSAKTQPEDKKSRLIDNYMQQVDTAYVTPVGNSTIEEKCGFCGNEETYIIQNEGISVCCHCSTIDYIICDNDKPSYKEPPKEISYFSYKRINHFNEWISQIQGKETTEIPEDVFNMIFLELKKQKMYNLSKITQTKIKEILKKHKLNRYYEHSSYICQRISGVANPHLCVELEEKLRGMFRDIQVPFLKHSPPNRKNFLSYSYVLHKLLQLLEEDEYLSHFPLLKSRQKLFQQEQIWKKICHELKWQFIPSI